MVNNLIRWSLNNKTLVIFISIILFLAGILTAKNLSIDVLPEFAPPQVIIETSAPGLAAEEVETIVTIPLENRLNGIAKVQSVRSASIEGLSFITVIFDWGTDIYNARQLVNEQVQSVSSNFPSGIEKPALIPITSPIGNIYFFAIYSKNPESANATSLMEIRSFADWEIKNKLLSTPGVSNVLVYGGDLKQYQILINPNKLKHYDIGLNEVINACEKSNLVVGGGFLLNKDREFQIRGLGKIEDLNQLSNSFISIKNHVPIRLIDIADIKINPAFKRSHGSVNGREAVIVAVSKQPWIDTLKLNKKIKTKLRDLRKNLPSDIEITETYSQSDFIETSINNILLAIVQGAILSLLVLYFFLGNWKISFISFTAIPLSVVISILILKFFNQTINAMTLGGLAVAVGAVVDDAIIDVENIYRKLKENEKNKNPKALFDVIFEASREVRNPILYGTVIITLILIPLFLLSGLAGQIFKPLAIAYITAIFVSTIVALSVTPALSFLLLKKNDLTVEAKIIQKTKIKYLELLDKILKNPKNIIFVTCLSFVLSLILLSQFGRSFLPELGEENLVVMTFIPPGSSLKATHELALNLEKKFLNNKNIVRVGNRAGRSEEEYEPITANISHFDITLKKGIPKKLKEKVVNYIQKEFEKLPGVQALVRSFISETIEHVISGARSPIVLKIYGSDLNILREEAFKLQELLEEIKLLTEIQVEQVSDIPQIHIKIKRDIAARYGLSAGDILKTTAIAFNGIKTSQKIIEGQRTFDLLIWFSESYRNNLDTIKNTLIDTSSGIKIPLGLVAEIIEEKGPNVINRENASRRILIQANAKKRDTANAAKQIQKIIQRLSLPVGYTIDFEGEYIEQKKVNNYLMFLTFFIVLFIFVLLSALFKSTKISLVILINLPLALIGGIIAILFSDRILSVGSMVGFITLFGITTRNAILLINRFLELQHEGLSLNEAIRQGSSDRFYPVIMTALATTFAVIPLALFPGAGREIEHPLAVVILGGMISATALTLLFIPVVYQSLHKEFKK